MQTRTRDRALARAVHDFAVECGSRRAVPTSLYAGSPLGERLPIPLHDWYDAALRADLLERALSVLATPEPLVWITRSGTTRPGDADQSWCAATLTAGARLGLTVSFFIVTRRAWLDPQTGAGRTWTRIRVHSPAAAG